MKPVSVFTQSDSLVRIAVTTSAIPHFILNEEKLAGLAVTDVGTAMKFIPGMQLKDYGGIGGIKTVSFRSLGATHTSVLLDGTRIPNVQSGSVNLGAFEIFGVKELSFTSGQAEESNAPASAYLQANSISVKSILAEKPAKFTTILYSNAATVSSFEQGILMQVPISKNVFAGVQAMTKSGEGDYEFVYAPAGISTRQKRVNSALFSYKIRSVVGLQFKKSKTLISANYYNNEQQLPGAIILYNPSNDQKLWNEDTRFSVLHEHRFRQWKLDLNGFYQSAHLHYYDPSFLNLQGAIDNSFLQQNAGGGWMLRRLILDDKAVFLWGSDLVYAKLTGSNVTSNPERSESNSVAGFSGKFGPVKIESNLTFQLIGDAFKSDDSLVARNFKQLSPFVSVSWTPFKSGEFRIRSFYKRAFSMPTFNDLYYTFIGNTMLRPEKADLFNLGGTWIKKIGNWTGEFYADAFYNRVHDKIIAIPTKDIFNWSMQNIGEIQATGVDAGFLVSMSKGLWILTMNGSYTYNLSLDKTDPESTTYDQQLPYTPFRSGTAGVAVAVKNFRLNVNALYTGFRYSLNENNYANYLEPFTDLSVSFSAGTNFTKLFYLDARIAVMNIFNRNYEVVRSFPMPGRFYQFTLQLKTR